MRLSKLYFARLKYDIFGHLRSDSQQNQHEMTGADPGEKAFLLIA
jgi:hypothetical protein